MSLLPDPCPAPGCPGLEGHTGPHAFQATYCDAVWINPDGSEARACVLPADHASVYHRHPSGARWRLAARPAPDATLPHDA